LQSNCMIANPDIGILSIITRTDIVRCMPCEK
jgi:hypothetical protein